MQHSIAPLTENSAPASQVSQDYRRPRILRGLAATNNRNQSLPLLRQVRVNTGH